MRSAPYSGARVVGGDRDVVEKAKAHRPVTFGVMSRWANLAEGIRCVSRHHDIDGVEAGADGSAGGFPRAGRYDRIGIDIFVTARHVLCDFADLRQMLLAVRQRDIGLIVVAQRCSPALEGFEGLHRQRLVDGAHPIRPLGVSLARVVIEKGWMRDEDRCHYRRAFPVRCFSTA